jgi:hypothetical protein
VVCVATNILMGEKVSSCYRSGPEQFQQEHICTFTIGVSGKIEFTVWMCFSRSHLICNVGGSCNWPVSSGMAVVLLRAALLFSGTLTV